MNAKPDPSSQPVQALRVANRVRRARSELKARVADGRLAAADVIRGCPAEAAGMPIGQLLRSQRGWGNTRCRAFLAQLSLPDHKAIGSLTERQRRVAASLLSPPSAGAGSGRSACPSTTTAGSRTETQHGSR